MARELSIDVEVTGTQHAAQELGQVDTALVRVEDSAKKAGPALDKTAQSTKSVGTQAKATAGDMQGLSQVILRYAGPTIVVAAARQTLEFADRIKSLSDNVKVNAVVLQQWGHVATKNGSSLQSVAEAVQRLGANVASGAKPIQEVMRDLHLDTERLLSLDPEQRFREVAEAIAKIQNPATQAHAAQKLLNQSGRDLISTLEDIARGVDKNAPAMSSSWVNANAAVKSSLDEVLASATNVGMWMIGWAPVLMQKAGEIGDAWQKNVLQRIYGVQGGVSPLPIPGRPDGANWGQPTPAGALPLPTNLDGSPMTTLPFVPAPGARAGRGGRALPFQSIGGSNAAALFAFANDPRNGTFAAGSLPFMSSLSPLASSPTLSWANGSQLSSGASMNAPGGGNWLSNLFAGRSGQVAGLGMGLLGGLIPGLNRTGSSIGGSIGSLFGPLGSGLGSLLGGGLGSLFGRGKAEKNARSAETMQVFGQFSSKEFIELQSRADRLGISMEKALSAKTMEAFGEATAEVAGKLGQVDTINGDIAGQLRVIDQLGGGLGPEFQPMVDRLREAGLLSGDVADEFSRMGQQGPSWQAMASAAQTLGISTDHLGRSFQQLRLNAQAQEITDAMDVLTRGGADMSAVTLEASDRFNDLVQQSLDAGTTIPSNLRPYLQTLADAGELVDAQGREIRDLSTLQFGDPLESQFQQAVAKLSEMVQKLDELPQKFADAMRAAQGLGAAIGAIPEIPEGAGGGESASSGVSSFRGPGLPSRGDVSGANVVAINGGVTLNIGGNTRNRAEFVEQVGTAFVEYFEKRGHRLVA